MSEDHASVIHSPTTWAAIEAERDAAHKRNNQNQTDLQTTSSPLQHTEA